MKTPHFTFRCSEEEKKLINDNAELLGFKNSSEYARERLLTIDSWNSPESVEKVRLAFNIIAGTISASEITGDSGKLLGIPLEVQKKESFTDDFLKQKCIDVLLELYFRKGVKK